MNERGGGNYGTYAKSKQTVARIKLMDSDSGEVLDDGKLVYVPRKVRIRDFFMAMQDGFESLANIELTKTDFRVFLILLGRMDYENTVVVFQKDIARALCINAQAVSRSMKSLRSKEIISQTECRSVRIHHRFAWKGKVGNLRQEQARTREAEDQQVQTLINAADQRLKKKHIPAGIEMADCPFN